MPSTHVLGRNRERTTVSRRKDVPGRSHQKRCLNLRLWTKRNMDRHLITIKIGIECAANQRDECGSPFPPPERVRMPESRDDEGSGRD